MTIQQTSVKMNKLMLVGVAFVAVVVVVAAAVVMSDGGDEGSKSNNNGEYNYSLSTVSSFNWTGVSGTTYVKTPDAGNVFIVATIVLKNLNYSDGISTSYYNFDLSASGVKYNADSATVSHPGYKSTVTLEKGGKYTFTAVYQVPAGTTDAQIIWGGWVPKVVYNSALEIGPSDGGGSSSSEESSPGFSHTGKSVNVAALGLLPDISSFPSGWMESVSPSSSGSNVVSSAEGTYINIGGYSAYTIVINIDVYDTTENAKAAYSNRISGISVTSKNVFEQCSTFTMGITYYVFQDMNVYGEIMVLGSPYLSSTQWNNILTNIETKLHSVAI